MRRRESPAPPEFFVDRSLGAKIVPGALRACGLTVHVMAEDYPNMGEKLDDEDWIPEVAAKGWLILLCDNRVRRNVLERRAILKYRAKVFAITNGNLKGAVMAERYVKHRNRIIQRAHKDGPYAWGVYADGLELLKLRHA